MKIYYKSAHDIEMIRRSGEVLGKAHGEVAKNVRPGVKTKKLDQIAQEFIRDNKGTPSFLGLPSPSGAGAFPGALCISINDEIVHGLPSNYELKDGDIVSIDCGVYLDGYHSDSAYTYPVGEVSEDVLHLLKTTKESLYLAIENAKQGKRLGDIGYAVQNHVEQYGYSVVRELVGHGLGKDLHEKPEVPNFGRRGKGTKLKNGLVIAIEPMINLGRKDIVQNDDGWTICTRDKKPSAHYEHTVAIHNNKTEVLTTFKYIEEVGF